MKKIYKILDIFSITSCPVIDLEQINCSSVPFFNGHQFQSPGSKSLFDQQLLQTSLLIIRVTPSKGSKSTSVKPDIMTVGTPEAHANQLKPSIKGGDRACPPDRPCAFAMMLYYLQIHHRNRGMPTRRRRQPQRAFSYSLR